MDTEGLGYNIQCEELILPEYGHGVRNMVNHAASLINKDGRQRCAETIITIMARMFPQSRENKDVQRRM